MCLHHPANEHVFGLWEYPKQRQSHSHRACAETSRRKKTVIKLRTFWLCLFPPVSYDLPGVLVSWLFKKLLVCSILQYGTIASVLHGNFCLCRQGETLFCSVSDQTHQFMDMGRVCRRESWEYEAFSIVLSILSQSGLARFVCVPVTVAHSLLF